MKKKKTVYLHIGMPKTGTSFIQNFIKINKGNLKNYGILYPDFQNKRFPNCIEEDTVYGNMMDMTVKNINPLILYTADEIKKKHGKLIQKTLQASEQNKILFSGDALFSGIDVSICDIFKGCNVKIIAYLRKPAEFLTSEWAEVVKSLWFVKDDLLSFCKTRYINYAKIKEYISALGRENVIVRPYEKEQWKNNKLLDDFLNCLGLETQKDFIIPKNINITPSRNTIEILRLKNSIGLDNNLQNYYRNKILRSPKIEDNRKLIETVSDNNILEMTQKWIPLIDEVAQIYDKEKFFLNDFPDCYGKERPIFNGIALTLEDAEIIREAAAYRSIAKNSKDDSCSIKSFFKKISTALNI